MKRSPLIIIGIALSLSLVPAQAASCSSILSWLWQRPYRTLGAGLLASSLSYGAFELAVTDPIGHRYPAAQPVSRDRHTHLALIGDSLSTDFVYSDNPLGNLFRLRTTRFGGWFADRAQDSNRSYSEICAGDQSVTADCYAQAGASILGSPDASFGKRLGQINHLSAQADGLLNGAHFPDHVLIWIGHNDLDFVYSCDKDVSLDRDTYCAVLTDRMTKALEEHLVRLGDHAKTQGKPVAITVFGLMEHENSALVRKQIRIAHTKDLTQYPYLRQGIEGFPTVAPKDPEDSERARRLSLVINQDWRQMVERLNEKFAGTAVRYFFSSVLSEFPYEKEDYAEDGLHLSAHGRARLSQAAFDGTQAQRDFISGAAP